MDSVVEQLRPHGRAAIRESRGSMWQLTGRMPGPAPEASFTTNEKDATIEPAAESEPTPATPARPVRAAVIGTGFVGPFHVDAVRRGGYGEVVAIAGSDERRTAARAAALGVARWTTDVRTILDDPSIDVVHVCTPNRLLTRRPEDGPPPGPGIPSLPAGHPEGWAEALRDLLRPFYAAVAAGAEPADVPTGSAYPTLEDGVRSVTFVEAVLESARRGAWVSLSG